MKIIDMHTHIFPEKVATEAINNIGKYYGKAMSKKGTAIDLSQEMKKEDISYSLVCSTATRIGQVNAINKFVSEQVKKYPEFIGFGTIHQDVKDPNKEIDEIIALGLKGIKLHPEFQVFNIDSSKMMKIYEAAEGRLPILMHMGDENKDSSSPKRLAKVLDKFPKIKMIAAHFGGYMAWDEVIEYLVGRDVYFDTSSSLWKIDKKQAMNIIEKHGVEKILFGTDYPMWSYKEEIERFMQLPLSKEQQELILYKNAHKFLHLK